MQLKGTKREKFGRRESNPEIENAWEGTK